MNQLSVSILGPLLLVGTLGGCSGGAYAEVGPPLPDDRPRASNGDDDVYDPNATLAPAPATSSASPSADDGSFRGVYITSRKSLYRFDVAAKTVRKVGDYDCVGSMDSSYAVGSGMSDIAVDRHGAMYGVAMRGTKEGLLIRIDALNAKCLEQQSVGDFALRGLEALAGATPADDDAIVSTSDARYVGVQIGAASLSLRGAVSLRAMGFVEDIVSIPDAGVFAVDYAVSTNARPRLVRIDPATGAAQSVVGIVDSARVTGLAYWEKTLYGVTFDRHVIAIDPKTAAKSDVAVDVEAGEDDFSGAAATALSAVR